MSTELKLTKRQKEVKHLLDSGLDKKAIASKLKIIPATVNQHIIAIENKIHTNALQAARASHGQQQGQQPENQRKINLYAPNLTSKKEAQRMHCPFAAVVDLDGKLHSSGNRVCFSMSEQGRGWNEKKWEEAYKIAQEIDRACNCRTDGCMAWRWAEPERIHPPLSQQPCEYGYCAKLGVPQSLTTF